MVILNRKFRKIGLFLSAMLMFNTINVPLTFAQENCVEDTTEINESKNTWGSNITNQSLNENQGNYLTIGEVEKEINSENKSDLTILPPINGYRSGTFYDLHLTKGLLTNGGNSLLSDICERFYVLGE